MGNSTIRMPSILNGMFSENISVNDSLSSYDFGGRVLEIFIQTIHISVDRHIVCITPLQTSLQRFGRYNKYDFSQSISSLYRRLHSLCLPFICMPPTFPET